MIKLFLNNLFFTNLLLLPYIALLRIKSFINPVDHAHLADNNLITEFIYTLFSPFAQSLFAVFLIFIQANIVNFIYNSNRITSKNNLLSGLFFALGCSFLPDFLILHPIMIANTFILLSFLHISQLYKSFKPILNTYMAGFNIGLAILIVPHYLLLLFFFLQSMIILRDISIKEFIQGISGIVTPVFLIYTVLLISKENFHFLDLFQLSFKIPDIVIVPTIGNVLIGLIFFLLLALIVVNNGNLRKKKGIKAQKVITLLYLLMAYGVFMLPFASAQSVFHLSYLMFPISILYAIFFYAKKNLVVSEIIHVAMIILVVLFHFNLI